MGQAVASVWILGDQLLADHPALVAAEESVGRRNVRVLLIESAARHAKREYQKKKTVLMLSAMRHFAAELGTIGYQVDLVRSPDFTTGLRRHAERMNPVRFYSMLAADYSGRRFQQTRLAEITGSQVSLVGNSQFLTGRYDPYPESGESKRVVLEYFYRKMRQHFGILLNADGEPAGGEWNFDRQNRKPLPRGGLSSPAPLSFAPDTITQEVMAEVAERRFGIGNVEGFDLAVTREQASQALDDFVANRLPDFGPFEDAMSHENGLLFHSRLSPYLNLGLLNPLDMIRQAELAFAEGRAPINSVEGFIRQILGWREYIYWQYWRLMPGLLNANHWGHVRPIPRLLWDGETDMACLRSIVKRVVASGYSHHIERLMVICNFCMLAGVEPNLVNEWFLSFYIDAHEWVVTPNVVGMGLNADGGVTATKPYVASANYINKMSDYCQGCRYDHRARSGTDACPFNYLYWNFLLENEAELRANPRFGPAVLGLRRLDDDERTQVRDDAKQFLQQLEPYSEN